MRKDTSISAGDYTMKMGIVDDYLCAICDDGGLLVLKCQNKYCERFYHPNCLLKYDPSKNHRNFECPLRECHSCKNKRGTIITRKQAGKEEETYLVQCRRCPVAYHRKCLPRDISNVADGEVSRTWTIKEQPQEQERWFFYCRKHEMVEEHNSATRDHLKFPEKPVFNFDLNEKLPEETEAPEPNASTSSAPMESSASRPKSPCQPIGLGGWQELDD